MIKWKKCAVYAAAMTIALGIAGCAKEEEPTYVYQVTTESETGTTQPETSSEPVTTVPQTIETEAASSASSAAPATQAPLDLSDLSIFPNTTVPFGYSAEVDERNVPTGASYYKSLYGQYQADFIQDTSKNIIYLTMDEGYEAGHTPQILDTLKDKGVKAVFFVTKQFFNSNPELIQRMIDEGHVIGNHTCSHPAAGMPTLGVDAEREDIMQLHNLILEEFGYDMKLFRFPAGIFSEQSLALVQTLGYTSVFWSFAYKDYVLEEQPESAESLQRCIDRLHPGAIYLLHAVSSTNTQILGDFIDAARAQGYEFGVYPEEG